MTSLTDLAPARKPFPAVCPLCGEIVTTPTATALDHLGVWARYFLCAAGHSFDVRWAK